MKRLRPDALILVAVLVASGFMYSAPAPRPSSQAIPAATVSTRVSSGDSASGTPATTAGAPENVASDGPGENKAGAAELPAPGHGEASPAIGTGAPQPSPSGVGKVPQRVRKAVADPTVAPAATRAAVARSTAPRPSTRPLTGSDGVVRGLRGGASYYGTGGPGKYGAMHEYRDGTRVVVVVTSFHDGHTYSVTVPIVTQCGACRFRSGETLVDLSVPAWLELGWPLSRGIAPVTVTILEGSLR